MTLDAPGVEEAADAGAVGAAAGGLLGVVVLQGSLTAKHLKSFSARGLPVVTVNFRKTGLAAVYPDHYDGARQAVAHLLSLGHRRLAHLNSGEKALHWEEVKRAYKHALSKAGLTLKDNPVVEGRGVEGGTIEVGYELARELWKRRLRPTGIFAGNDLMAIGAMRFLHEQGVHVPRDVSMVGFDDIHAAEICTPALTTIGVDRVGMGRRAVRMLIALPRRAGPAAPQEKLKVLLVQRSSTARVD
jgi:LacI family transcriptional regulator